VRYLTVDLGNSRCKLLEWEEQEPGERLDLPREEGLDARVEAWLADRPRPFAIALSSVAGPGAMSGLGRLLEPLADGPLLVGPDPGLHNECRDPGGTGWDRLYAARAALEVIGSSCLVVDAGTALTVDAVRRAGEDRFLGGAIAPGPTLLAEALGRGGAQLFEVRPEPGAAALGRDTREALAAGVAIGFRGAARELVERVAAEAGLEEAPVVLTGGARSYLTQPGPFTARELEIREDLVHQGLHWACRAALARGPKSEEGAS